MPENINVRLLYRKMMGEIRSKRDEQQFAIWYEASEAHRDYYARYCIQQKRIMSRECSFVNTKAAQLRMKRRLRVKRVKKIVWRGIAAALFWGVILGGIWWNQRQATDLSTPIVQQKRPLDVLLTLSEGEQVVLDSLPQEQMIKHHSMTLRVEDRTLRYEQDTVKTSKPRFNELNVPPTKNFTLVLAEGTKIHLNAASRLRYPVTFSGKERRVTLVGEAYFEVAESEVPFIVETCLGEVKVFGTEFNVMVYEEEQEMQTTLVKGSVGVRLEDTVFHRIVPGEQFCRNRESGKYKIRTVELFPYVAWKEGLFVSRNEDLASIMRKIARWFNVEVVYAQEDLKKKRFFGIMKREMTLREVLDVIEETGEIVTRIENQKVFIDKKS